MPGINRTTIEHQLNTDPTFKPIRQKRRTFAAERNMAISEEVNKLMKADFIQEVHYPDWLANVVLGITKSQCTRQTEIKPLSSRTEVYIAIRKHQMKLNPSKCAFGVSSGKFLGYMVSRRGIEANPEKVQAILNMQSPASTKELQRLTGRIAALNRLISRATDRCLPFSVCSVSLALVREEDGNQKPVYYISRAFRGAEERYPRIEKLAFALVISARKLRPYFQAHTIIVLTDQPLRQVLRKPDTSGRLMKWSVELREFDIQYKPRTALKAQVLANVIAEFTPEDGPEHAVDKQEEAESTWTLYVDGSINARASGAGLVIISPNGECIKYALRFGFKATNNEAEYEALLAGLRIAKALEGEYEAKDEKMKTYLHKIEDIKGFFKKFSIHRIPREENAQADALARLATTEEDKAIPVGYLDEPSTVWDWPQKIHQVGHGMEWAEPIIRYIENEELPQDRMEA
ncbi:uncharacterized protein LOC132275612 [Cornus florida]|uniref:uncharacterized protein LOC132275612 n=1 Tax=Cornus florida TaxID=4283 RepID=UPI00289C6409|nr:uncharacterized protein LOC132275612 [Cornus florida]